MMLADISTIEAWSTGSSWRKGYRDYNPRWDGRGRFPLIFESRLEKADVARQFSMRFLHFCMTCEQGMNGPTVLHYIFKEVV